MLPEFVAACGFQNAKAPGFEADDFLAADAAKEERRGGTVLIASGDRDTFQLASERTTILYPVRAGEMARIDPAEVRARYSVDPDQVPDLLPCAATPQIRCQAHPALAQLALRLCLNDTAVLKLRSPPAGFRGFTLSCFPTHLGWGCFKNDGAVSKTSRSHQLFVHRTEANPAQMPLATTRKNAGIVDTDRSAPSP